MNLTLTIIEYYFILIVFSPVGTLEVQQFGPFDSKADCKTMENVIPMRFPASYLRIEVVECWKNEIKIRVSDADKTKYEEQKK